MWSLLIWKERNNIHHSLFLKHLYRLVNNIGLIKVISMKLTNSLIYFCYYAAVSYPFLFCLSRSFLEVKNMTNGVYHEILRKPNPNIDLLFDDGR